MIFLFLVSDVLPNRRLVSTYGRNKVSPRPEAAAYAVLFPLAVNPCQVNRALALNEPNHMRHSMLKQLIRPVRGFKTLKTAYATITGFEVMRTLLLQQSYFEFLIAPVKAAPFARL